MNTDTNTDKRNHLGYKVKRMRTVLGMKQETLANKLNKDEKDDWNQKKVSLLESKQHIEPVLLKEVAEALGVTVEAIEQFNDEVITYNIQNNHPGSNTNAGNVIGGNSNFYDCTFHFASDHIETLKQWKAEKDQEIQALKDRLKDLEGNK